MSESTQEHGWIAVPRSLSKLIGSRTDPKPSVAVKVEDIPVPDSPLVQEVMRYAREKLEQETFNHSMRVYYYDQAMLMQHFPSWSFSPETYLLAALLHDIGTTAEKQESTRLLFEFQDGFIALDLLKSLHANASQAEAVCETIIRHEDLGETGNMTALCAIIHFATVLDNAGLNAELVHEDTIKSVVAEFPRNGWTTCFAGVVRKECELKPWSNTTRIEGFAGMVEANKLMEPFENTS